MDEIWGSLLATFPALVATITLQYSPPLANLLFTVGWRVFADNLCLLILFPYIVLFLLSAGRILFPHARTLAGLGLSALEIELALFFSGSGVVGLLGVALGGLHLLTPWLTIPIFLIGVFFQIQRSPELARRFFAWIIKNRAADHDAGRAVRVTSRALTTLILLSSAYLLLTKGIFPEIRFGDVQSVYLPFFESVRDAHSIWMNPANPMLHYFISFRGYGVYLILTNVGGEFALQMVSLVYLGSIAFIADRVVARLIPAKKNVRFESAARIVLPPAVVLLVITSPILMQESARLHFQDSALMMFIAWGASLICVLDDKDRRWITLVMIPAAAYLGFSLPQSQAFVLPVLLASALIQFLKREPRSWRSIHSLSIVELVGIGAAGASLLFNQLYAGIAAVNPMWPFIEIANADRVARLGTSLDLMRYMESAQSHVSTSILGQITGELSALGGRMIWIWIFILPAILLNGLRRFPSRIGAVVIAHLALAFILAPGWYHVNLPGSFFPSAYTPLGYGLGLAGTLISLAIALPLFSRFAVQASRSVRSSNLGLCNNSVSFAFIFLVSYGVVWVLYWVVGTQVTLRVLQLRYAYAAILFCTVFLAGAWSLDSNVETSIGTADRKFISALALVMSALIATLGAFVTNSVLLGVLFAASSLYALKAVMPDDLLLDHFETCDEKANMAVPFLSMISDVTVCIFGAVCIYVATVGMSAFYATQRPFGSSPIIRASSYFLGLTSLSDNLPTRDFKLCKALDQIVPSGETILALNANLTLVPDCYSLLPHGRIVDDYQTHLARYYREIIAGNADDALRALKAANVNYFYVARNDVYFWGPSWSEAFSFQSLRDNFGVVAKNEKYYLLTWLAPPLRRVGEDDAWEITKLRSRARLEFPTWQGAAALR